MIDDTVYMMVETNREYSKMYVLEYDIETMEVRCRIRIAGDPKRDSSVVEFAHRILGCKKKMLEEHGTTVRVIEDHCRKGIHDRLAGRTKEFKYECCAKAFADYCDDQVKKEERESSRN